MFSKTIKISASGNTMKSHKATVIYCTEGPAGHELIIKYGNKNSRLVKGWAYPLVDGFEIINLTATDQEVEFVYLDAQEAQFFKDTRMIESGPQSILGTVGTVGQPLVDDGGSINTIGASNYANFAVTTAISDIMDKNLNTNGAIIRTLLLSKVSGVGGLTSRIRHVDNSFSSFMMIRENGSFDRISRPIFINAGEELEVSITAANVGECLITYDYL